MLKKKKISFDHFLTRVVEEGIRAAKRDYKREDQKAILEGSIAGFKACLGKDVAGLCLLLAEARKKTIATRKACPNKKELDKYWKARGYELEVEWVCNCVSCVLYNEHKPTIIPPTARAMVFTSKIIGVKEALE